MNVLDRRMFQEGGAVLSKGSGFSPFQKGESEFVRDENGRTIFREYDIQGNIINEEIVDVRLSPTRDPSEALRIQRRNKAIQATLESAPYVAGGTLAGAGIKGLVGSQLGKNIMSGLAKAGSGVASGAKAVGEFLLPYRFLPQSQRAKGIEGLKKMSPYDPKSYTEGVLKIKPVTAGTYGYGAFETFKDPIMGGLMASPTDIDKSPEFISAQYGIISDPESSEEDKQRARDLIQEAIAPDIQSDLDALAAQETQPKPEEEVSEVVAEVADEMKDDVEAETPELSVEEKGQTDINKEVDKRVKSDAKLLDFSNDRFLSAIRNIGASLVSEMQMGSGLAKGATAFAEEQAAKDLMREQAELEKQAKMEELLLEASLKGDQTLSPSDLKTLRTFGSEVSQNVADFQGGQAALAFMDTIIEEIENAPPGKIGGFQGWLDSMGSKLNALLGTDVPLAQLGPQAKIEALAKVVQQGNLQAILGESGRTISDKDRAIVVEVFGTPGLFDNRDIALEKLRASRSKLRNANVRRKSDVQMTYDLIKDPAFGIQGKQMALSLMPSLQALLNIDPTSPIQKGDFEELINISLRE